MKERAELVLGWLRKAQSESVALDATLGATALDAACFHAQQAAEKYLKAFLTHHDVRSACGPRVCARPAAEAVRRGGRLMPKHDIIENRRERHRGR